jgi:flagellar FliJ protein
MRGKKFRFSLQSVLRLRQHQTEQAAEALAQVMHARLQLEQQLAQAQQELEHLESLLVLEQRALDPLQLRRYEAHWLSAKRQLRKLEHQLERLRQQEAEARQQVLACHQAEASLERLRDHQKAQHLQAELAAENAWIDEHATGAYVRKHLNPRMP